MYEHDSLVAIFEAAFASKDEVHDYLAEAFDLPGHYGRNLDALRDCLTELNEPVLVSVVRSREETGLSAWFDKLCLCLMVCVRENPALDLEVIYESDESDEAQAWPLDEEGGLD